MSTVNVYNFTPTPDTIGKVQKRENKIKKILEAISHPKYNLDLIVVKGKKGAQFFLRVVKTGAEGRDGELLAKLEHYAMAISGHENETELVRAVYDQIVMLETHEVAEFFQYKSVRVYDPHRPLITD